MANRLAKVVNKPKNGKQKPVPVKIVNDSSMRTASMPDDMKWRAKDALRTLAEAERIRKDKPLMKAAKAEAKNQMKELSTVCK